MRRLALALVFIHALVILSHDAAHRELAIKLNDWQTIFVFSVIVAAPFLAALLAFTQYARLGFGLLAVSMSGAFLFGIYHHYILISPDHVAHLPGGESQGLFRASAAVMAFLEFAGVGLGVWGWRSHSFPSRAL